MLISTMDLGSSDLPGDLVLAHPDVIRCYYRDIDPTLIRENLKLTPIERLRKLEEFVSFLVELREAKRAHANAPTTVPLQPGPETWRP